MHRPDHKLAELRSLLAAEGVTIRSLRRCAVSGVLIAHGEAEAAEHVKDGWTILAQDGHHYLMADIEPGEWLADPEPHPLPDGREMEL